MPNHFTMLAATTGAKFDYDVALIKIKPDNGRGIIFNDYEQPACLPHRDTPYIPRTLCYISGWGKKETGGNTNAEYACLKRFTNKMTNRIQYK